MSYSRQGQSPEKRMRKRKSPVRATWIWKSAINAAPPGLDPPVWPIPGTQISGYTTKPLQGDRQRLRSLRDNKQIR
jgi:hypothetical protein